MTQAELLEYRQLKRDKREAEQAVKDIEASIDGLKAVVIDGMPHGSRRRAGLENIVIKYEEQLERYYGKLADIITRMERIEDAVNSLPAWPRRICKLYYLSGEHRRTFYQIALNLPYSERQVRRFHEEALKKLANYE